MWDFHGKLDMWENAEYIKNVIESRLIRGTKICKFVNFQLGK